MIGNPEHFAPVRLAERQSWWDRYEVYCNRSKKCWHCNGPTVELFIPHGWFAVGRGRVRKLWAQQVCPVCFEHEFAIIEAEDDGRRFSKVELTDRCLCGRAVLPPIGECVLCHRERRMLSKQQAQLRLTRRMLLQLRQGIRDAKELARGH